MPGLAIAGIDTEGREPVEIECWKVPARELDRGSLQVPCLGALKVSQLLALRNEAGRRPIRLVDRGWCRGCEAGFGTDFVATPLIDRANALLAEMGVPADEHPSIETRPLPERLRPQAIPDPAARRNLDRRAFFTGVAREMAAAAQEVRTLPATTEGEAPGFDRHAKVWPAERVAMLAELSRLSKRTGLPVPRVSFQSFMSMPTARTTASARRYARPVPCSPMRQAPSAAFSSRRTSAPPAGCVSRNARSGLSILWPRATANRPEPSST